MAIIFCGSHRAPSPMPITQPARVAIRQRARQQQVLNLLTGVSVSGPKLPQKVQQKINDACARLGENYLRATKLGIDEPGRYFNCWFLGVDALLTLLENVDSEAAFWQELKRTRHVSSGSLSWHFDYQWARRLDPKLADAVVRTGATVMMGS